jgi:hypothetical protein
MARPGRNAREFGMNWWIIVEPIEVGGSTATGFRPGIVKENE